MEQNLGNVVGLIKSVTEPTKKYVLWAHVVDPDSPDVVVLKRYNFDLEIWVSIGGDIIWGDIGGDIDNQADLKAALDSKVDIQAGFSLYPNDDAAKVDNIPADTITELSNKVDKVAGQTLYPASDASKVANLPSNTNTVLAGKQDTSAKDQPNGYAGVDSSGLILLAFIQRLINDAASSSLTETWSIYKIKTYVSGLLDLALKQPEGFTPSGSYPTTYAGGTIPKGATYKLSAGALSGSVTASFGDLLIANVASPGQTDANWQLLESNLDQATELVAGILKIAQDSDVQTVNASEDTRAVTSKKFWNGLVWWKTLVHTFAEIITFTKAPVFSSVSASQYLKVNGSKALIGLDFIPASDVTSVFRPKGDVDCSSNPNYPIGKVGDRYRVSVAGKIGGASGKVVAVDQEYYCVTDSVAGDEATVGASWRLSGGGSSTSSSTSTTRKINTMSQIYANQNFI